MDRFVILFLAATVVMAEERIAIEDAFEPIPLRMIRLEATPTRLTYPGTTTLTCKLNFDPKDSVYIKQIEDNGNIITYTRDCGVVNLRFGNTKQFCSTREYTFSFNQADVRLMKNGVWRCIVGQSIASADLTFVQIEKANAVTFPNRLSVKEGTFVSLHCSHQATATQPTTVRWFRHASATSKLSVALPAGAVVRHVASTYRSNLEWAVSEGDGGFYTCQFTNEAGAGAMAARTELVVTKSGVVLTANPRRAADGATITMTCTFTTQPDGIVFIERVTPTATKQVLEGNTCTKSSTDKSGEVPEGGATCKPGGLVYTLTFNQANMDDMATGFWKCRDSGGRISNQVVFKKIVGPTVKISPSSLRTWAGLSEELTCSYSAGATEPVQLTWYREGGSIPQTAQLVPSTRQLWLRFQSLAVEDAGKYYCKASNEAAEVTSTKLDLGVLYHPTNVTLLRIDPDTDQTSIVVQQDRIQVICRSDNFNTDFQSGTITIEKIQPDGKIPQKTFDKTAVQKNGYLEAIYDEELAEDEKAAGRLAMRCMFEGTFFGWLTRVNETHSTTSGGMKYIQLTSNFLNITFADEALPPGGEDNMELVYIMIMTGVAALLLILLVVFGLVVCCCLKRMNKRLSQMQTSAKYESGNTNLQFTNDGFTDVQSEKTTPTYPTPTPVRGPLPKPPPLDDQPRPKPPIILPKPPKIYQEDLPVMNYDEPRNLRPALSTEAEAAYEIPVSRANDDDGCERIPYYCSVP